MTRTARYAAGRRTTPGRPRPPTPHARAGRRDPHRATEGCQRHDHGGRREQHERRRVSGLLVQQPGEDGAQREPEAGQQADPCVARPATERIDRDGIGQRLPGAFEDPEGDDEADDDQRRPREEQRADRTAPPTAQMRRVRDRPRRTSAMWPHVGTAMVDPMAASEVIRPISPGPKPRSARITLMNGNQTPRATPSTITSTRSDVTTPSSTGDATVPGRVSGSCQQVTCSGRMLA